MASSLEVVSDLWLFSVYLDFTSPADMVTDSSLQLSGSEIPTLLGDLRFLGKKFSIGCQIPCLHTAVTNG